MDQALGPSCSMKSHTGSKCSVLEANLFILDVHSLENPLISCVLGVHTGGFEDKRRETRFRSAGLGRRVIALGRGFLEFIIRALNWCFIRGRGAGKKKKERQKEKLAPFSSSAPDLHNTFK